MKAADLSIWVAKDFMRAPPTPPESLVIADSLSMYDRFNDEKAWVEFMLTRVIPSRKSLKQTAIRGLIKGIHSDWAYKQLEAAADGVIDFRLEETSKGETLDLMRIRSLRNVAFTSGWHCLKFGENFEVTLEK